MHQFDVSLSQRVQIRFRQQRVQAADVVHAEGGRWGVLPQIQLPARRQQVLQPLAWHIVATHAEQKPVEQRPQRVVLRQPVAGADDHHQRPMARPCNASAIISGRRS